MVKRSVRRYALAMVIMLVLTISVAQVQARPPAQDDQGLAPTYTIFATREGLVGHGTANGHIIQPRDRFVALPSRSALCSYQGHEYQVRLTYQGRSVVVPVWDVGPWNTNDDYWSPNRRYSDLPVGVPMAQAAYLEGYNGGRDEFGRMIRDPNGIDIADGTFWDDLGMTRNDWVQVSFLWLGRDPGPGGATNVLPPPTAGQQEVPPLNLPPAAPAPAPTPVPAAVNGNAPAPQRSPEDRYNLRGPPLDSPRAESGAIALDNGTDGYQAADAPWYTANCGLNGQHAWTFSTPDPAESEHHAIWRPSLTPGWYEIRAYIPPCGYTSATRSARYRVTSNGVVTEVALDQEAAAGTWASLGTYEVTGQGANLVELNDLTGDSMQSVRFDTVAWVPVNDTTPPDARVVAIARQGNGYLVEWGGTDDVSGIVSYDVQVRQLPDGGWRDWVRDAVGTMAWFGPDEGYHFAFRVRARDRFGNVEPWPEAADGETRGVGDAGE